MKVRSLATPGRILVVSLLLAASMLAATMAAPASAQQSSPIGNLRATHQFGSQIEFFADLAPGTDFTEAFLTFQSTSSSQSIVLTAEEQEPNLLTAWYENATQNPLPAFSRLTFWFTLKLASGSTIESEKVTYLFSDNRFEWQTFSLGNKSDVNWVEGDISLGQSVADVINQHKSSFSRYLDLPYPEELHIYIYPTTTAFRSALEISQIPWASGHANPDQSTILVAIPIGFDQQLDIQRQIPHEIAHIRLALYLDGSTDPLPTWFNEGIASLAENFTAPEHWQILQTAFQLDDLLQMEALCESFPYSNDDAALAYAQSESFVRYLHDRYGKAGLQALLEAYKQGHTCQNGVQVTLGISLERLEADWYKETFDSGIVPRSVGTILTWVVLLVILLAAPIIMILITSRRKGGSQ
ncbi:MAG: peptidase MA family metallohydrolase [Anaerolineales bacterium]